MVPRGPGLLPILILLVTCLPANPLFGGPTAILTGRVTDTIGGVIPGVKVQATNVETNPSANRDFSIFVIVGLSLFVG